MYKLITILLSAVLIVSFPIYCLADEETTLESIAETSESVSQEETQTEESSAEEEETIVESETIVDYWLVPMSSQIKVSWAEETQADLIGVYVSTDNEHYMYAGETEESFYIIEGLSHRKKYYVRLVINNENGETITQPQSVRVK